MEKFFLACPMDITFLHLDFLGLPCHAYLTLFEGLFSRQDQSECKNILRSYYLHKGQLNLQSFNSCISIIHLIYLDLLQCSGISDFSFDFLLSQCSQTLQYLRITSSSMKALHPPLSEVLGRPISSVGQEYHFPMPILFETVAACLCRCSRLQSLTWAHVEDAQEEAARVLQLPRTNESLLLQTLQDALYHLGSTCEALHFSGNLFGRFPTARMISNSCHKLQATTLPISAASPLCRISPVQNVVECIQHNPKLQYLSIPLVWGTGNLVEYVEQQVRAARTVLKTHVKAAFEMRGIIVHTPD